MTMFRALAIDDNIQVLKTADTASGSVASFETDLTENLIECECEIVYSQASGTPTPSNPIPITTFSEMNVVQMSDITNKSYFDGLLNGTYGFVDLGSLNWSGTGDTYFNIAKSVIGAKTVNDINMLCSYYETTSGGGDKTIYDTTNTIRVQDTTYETATDFTNAMQGVYLIYELATPTTPTITEAQFKTLLTAFGIDGELFNIPFGQNVAKGVLDVLSGKLSVEWLAVDLGSLSYTYYTSGTNPIFYASLSGSKIYATSDIPDCACSCYKVVGANNRTNLASNLNNYECSFITNGTNFTIRNDDYTDPTAFATAMVGQSVVYELASPLIVQLTSNQVQALLNENNIWCDTNGDTDVKFLLSVGKAIS